MRVCAGRSVMAEAQWETRICNCHIVKDCGMACCCQTCLGLPCIFGAAMERAGLGGCFPWCSALNCCPCCTGCNARAKVAEKYVPPILRNVVQWPSWLLPEQDRQHKDQHART